MLSKEQSMQTFNVISDFFAMIKLSMISMKVTNYTKIQNMNNVIQSNNKSKYRKQKLKLISMHQSIRKKRLIQDTLYYNLGK